MCYESLCPRFRVNTLSKQERIQSDTSKFQSQRLYYFPEFQKFEIDDAVFLYIGNSDFKFTTGNHSAEVIVESGST